MGTEPGTLRSPAPGHISCAACPVYKHEGVCTECRTNSTKLFVRDRMNSTEIFVRDRMNSTEIFVRDRTNRHCQKSILRKSNLFFGQPSVCYEDECKILCKSRFRIFHPCLCTREGY